VHLIRHRQREVARQLEHHPSLIFKKLSCTGGIQPVLRSRSSKAVSLADREVISRGSELADHKRFTIAMDIDVYFCDPSSPWQQGSNENTNVFCVSTFPKEQIYHCTLKVILIGLLESSTNDLEKR